MIAGEGLPTTANFHAPDISRETEEEDHVRHWTYHAFSRLGWMHHWTAQFFAIMAAGAILAGVGIFLVTYFIPPGCTAGTIAGVYYDCAISAPRSLDGESLAALRGLTPTTATPDDLTRGAVPVWIGVTQYVDVAMLESTMGANSRSAAGGALCVCGADYGLPLRVAAHNGVVMFNPRLNSTAGHIVFTFENSAVARATGFRPEMDGPSDAYVSYHTRSAEVNGEHCDRSCAACIVWCDALLAHVTR